MDVEVELTGVARAIARSRQVSLQLLEGATYRDVVCALGKAVPELIGVVIQPSGDDLLNANVLGSSEEDLVFPDQMDDPVRNPRLILLSIIVGG
jgi:hypothetical protein